MNERDILDKSIKDHEKAIAKAKKELAKLEVTYSIGDRFKYIGRSGEKCILVATSGTTATIVSLVDGRKIGKPYCVGSFKKITSSEYDEIRDCGAFTRYWNAQKGCEE